jgi:Co/Zn/Cd efflux system component
VLAAPVVAVAGGGLARSVFHMPGMDCPAEEGMIRLRLQGAPVVGLSFDLVARRLTVDHAGDPAELLERLRPLGYGATLLESGAVADAADRVDDAAQTDAAEARVLWWLLAINALMFVVEIGAGWLAGSAGLIADAMDMFADAAVYGVALYGVGRAAGVKLAAARLSGLFQLLLALGALGQTARHVLGGVEPASVAMLGVGFMALMANVACLLLIHRHRHRGAHMRASYIFSANDVIANLGVLAAGLLVMVTGRPWPDWVIGIAIGLVVLVGAVRILRLR